MASENNRSNIVFLIAALVGISTATFFIVRSRRKLDPGKRLDRMLDFCTSKADELEQMLRDDAQPSPATA
ncbi:MAG: hypothetical protein AMXMBFR61_04090 [Fimbriimonadales bacterium]